MIAYHRSSIEGRRRSSKSGGGEEPTDAWLQEHRYRKAVAVLQERQQSYTTAVCSAIEEARRLEEWRSEMSRKILARYCTKLFQVDTAMQSYANDAVRALANYQKEPIGSCGVLSDFTTLLQEAVPLPAEEQLAAQPASAEGSEQEER